MVRVDDLIRDIPIPFELMEPLNQIDTQKLNQGIQQLYTLDNSDTFGVEALTIVDRLVPSEVTSFQSTHIPTRQMSASFLQSSNATNFLTPERQQIIDRHYGEHPIVQHMPQTLAGAYKISDFVTQQELYCLEGLYQQYLGPFDIEDQMTLFLPSGAGDPANTWLPEPILVGFALNRTRRSFTERDRSILDLLRPHLFQSYTNAQKYQQLQQNFDRVQQSLDHLGAIALDPDGKIRSIAPQAIIWLETYFATAICTYQLPDRLWAWVRHQIANLTNNLDLPGACLPLRIQQSGRELTIRLVVAPAGAWYMLLLEEQTLSSFNSLELLGLSQRETEVLALLIKGKANKVISIELKIQIGTVRKHLENIYLKLGVQSRTEAIAQALAKLGYLHSLPLI
jgi:DNA-binding CsgD family transcriptional regulator